MGGLGALGEDLYECEEVGWLVVRMWMGGYEIAAVNGCVCHAGELCGGKSAG